VIIGEQHQLWTTVNTVFSGARDSRLLLRKSEGCTPAIIPIPADSNAEPKPKRQQQASPFRRAQLSVVNERDRECYDSSPRPFLSI